jgi:phage terminase large subunit-like protein
MSASLLDYLSLRDNETLKYLTADLSDDEWQTICGHWEFLARSNQLPPETTQTGLPWRVWLIMAGRGFGKTRCGAEWIIAQASENPTARLALVAATLHEGRSVMIEGESGLLNCAPLEFKPIWEVSKRRIIWPNGAQAFLYSAEEPDSLRGSQHHNAWCDELAKWPNASEVWMNLMMGLRLGETPKTVVTTTPRAMTQLRQIIADKYTAITRGATQENASNLPDGFMAMITEAWGGTRLGRQELNGELIEDVPGALWTRDSLEKYRVRVAPELTRIIIGVDPAVSAGDGADACGIIVAGCDKAGHFYVIEDATLQGASPLVWANAVIAAYARHQADRIIAEANNGGALVSTVLHQVEPNAPVELVHASRGKVVRAEPIALLYEQGKIHHVGAFPDLEDQLCGFISGGTYEGPGKSPDRADALVWAITALAKPVVEPKLRMI